MTAMSSGSAVLFLIGLAANGQELLNAQAAVSMAVAEKQCISFPTEPVEQRILSPHTGVLLRTRCEVVEFRRLGARWNAALYRWTVEFAQGSSSEEEAVLFEAADPQQLRPVWHARYETGEYRDWRSITPEVSVKSQGVFFAILRCIHGTGGCWQDFLLRAPAGQWTEVRQAWVDQLPAGFQDHMRKGFRLDPDTLRGEVGFYSDGDPNCCPSEQLLIELRLVGNSLQLVNYRVTRQP